MAVAWATRCALCHRPLSDARSIGRGVGPYCWSKIQAENRKMTEEQAAGAERSDYTYRIDRSGAAPVLVIHDLDRGRMSVTNNIEAIVARIVLDEGDEVRLMKAIYRDSQGNYDGIDLLHLGSKPFYSLGGLIRTEEDAIRTVACRGLTEW